MWELASDVVLQALYPSDRGYRGFPGTHPLKLSEKGLEQRFRHEFGRYTEDRRRGKGTSQQSVVLCCRHLRDFSDSFLVGDLVNRGNGAASFPLTSSLFGVINQSRRSR